MGVKVTVRDGETVADALKRFQGLVRRYGPPGTNVKRPRWHKNQLTYYLKPSERRRHLVCVIRRGAKRRKEHIGDAPVVDQYPLR
jgi:ribosomal protein S21